MTYLKYVSFLILSVTLIYSCQKEKFVTSPQAILYTSTDSLYFDTVFVTKGSITQSFKIFNGNEQKLLLSGVKLVGGAASPFKININGTPGPEVNNLTVDANDSIYVFVQVDINPSSGNLPYLVEDSILISYNGNQQYVKLSAYGQNAHFLNNITLVGNTTWTDTLPYVIIGGLLVDSNSTLSIQAGTRIYLHADAPLLVAGTLVANGTKTDSIVFNDDRLDPDYSDLPASWPGIYFTTSSKDNFLRHAIIKNAYQGIICQGPTVDANPKLYMTQCIINNIYDAGLLAINSNISANNCLISNCGSNINITLGGIYQFIFLTVASYNNFFIAHNNPVLQVSDAALQNNTVVTAPLNAFFQNSIFWGDLGSVDNEILVSHLGSNSYSVDFDHVLFKETDVPTAANFTTCIQNEDPLFDSTDVANNYYDFHFLKHPSSPAINSGASTTLPFDLDDNPRSDGIPDLGCYER
jgi:hypothetical protein